MVLGSSPVRLEPLSSTHAEDLARAAATLPDIWYVDHVPAPEGVGEQIAFLVASDNYRPWAIIDAAANRAVGITCIYNVDEHNKHCELGHTWISADVQGSYVNPAAKLLLLTHVFEDLRFMRAEFRCHTMNFQSRRALERLGAKFEGELRRYRIMNNGTVRDSRIYSILDYEWPMVKCGLEARLA
ncbi:Protein N-acetyltransferase, RimJ/RimL family [Corynebacterium timonense]|uniref:Protein N-acetyltransferase, RimJ/RimL family n=2 Tax=Corynebacterium timonense TaxID=441500 RepID=A0A1H1PZU8_9CORY|nr:Protein N-acetyltransferase, RimJ/RimL family [Corynebacterium timonense]